MKTQLLKAAIILVFVIPIAFTGFAQLNGFELTPSGNTEDYMKYIRKAVNVDGTNYYTAYLTLSAFKNISFLVL